MTRNNSKSTHRNFVRAALAVLLCIGVTGGASACGTPVPQPSRRSASVQTTPSVTTAQVRRIENAIFDSVHQADQKRDPHLLQTRLSGPELAIRSAQLQIEKSVNKTDPKMTIPRSIRQRVVPINSDWPRSIFVITSTTSDQQSGRLLVFNQQEAHDNYRLWGLVRLFSGIKLPQFEIPSIGSRQGTAQDSGLVMSPAQAVRLYARAMQQADKPIPAKVEKDQFLTSLGDLESSVQKGVAANAGSQSQVFTPDLNDIKIMRSADGGDLVVARIDSVWTRSAGEGRQAQPASDAEKALFGNQKATSTIRVRYVNVVALYVPPAAKNATVRAVGAEREPIEAKAL